MITLSAGVSKNLSDRLIGRRKIYYLNAQRTAHDDLHCGLRGCGRVRSSGGSLDAAALFKTATGIDECIKRSIVKSISTSHLSTLLAEAQLQPHKSRYWLNTKETDPEVFNEQVRTVCDCYLQAPKLLAQFDTHTVCIDEMTGIQALERIVPPKRCDPVWKNGLSSNTSATARCV